MSTYESITCSDVSHALEFVRYFPRQLITADDMRAADEYFREKMRRHNRMLHGWGVVCGCVVSPPKDKEPKLQVTISKGYILTPRGDEICISEDIPFDLTQGSYKAFDPCARPSPCSPATSVAAANDDTVYLAVCYSECNTRPVRLHPAGCGCGCDDSTCEYSRVRESYELLVLDTKPKSYDEAVKVDKQWVEWSKDREKNVLPDCQHWSESDCVVLASIKLSADHASIENILYTQRRVLLSTAALQAIQFASP